MKSFSHRHILKAEQFSKADLLYLLESAQLIHKCSEFARDEKENDWQNQIFSRNLRTALHGTILCSLFFEPSTRTRLSFESAMLRLGGQIINIVGSEFSSISKGETIADTLNMIEHYGDIAVIRHSMADSVAKMAHQSKIPMINAGDGSAEHPSQGLLDLYTIYVELPSLDNFTIAFIGDLKYSRTIHSLVTLLANFKVNIVFVSQSSLKLPLLYKQKLDEQNITYLETEDINEAREADVIYLTRMQVERHSTNNQESPEDTPYQINEEFIKNCSNPNILVMHPLPRGNELHCNVDNLKNAAYFRMAGYSVYLRMALLLLMLGKFPQELNHKD